MKTVRPVKFFYRGVHGQHPQIASALQGVVVPGDIHGKITPAQHNVGGFSDVSPYTSWSEKLEVARQHAFPEKGTRGVVLRVTTEKPGHSDLWHWEHSPDIHWEYEVLLFGVRMNLEVIES